MVKKYKVSARKRAQIRRETRAEKPHWTDGAINDVVKRYVKILEDAENERRAKEAAEKKKKK